MKRKPAPLGILPHCKWQFQHEPASRPGCAPSLGFWQNLGSAHSFSYETLTSAKIFAEWMLILAKAGCLPACLQKCWITCATWKIGDNFFSCVLVNTNNLYSNNNTLPRKQHFSASLDIYARIWVKMKQQRLGEHPVGGEYSAFCFFTGESRFTFENVWVHQLLYLVFAIGKVGEIG